MSKIFTESPDFNYTGLPIAFDFILMHQRKGGEYKHRIPVKLKVSVTKCKKVWDISSVQGPIKICAVISMQTFTTVWVRSMRAITVFFKSLSLAGASVKRNISELNGALVNASCKMMHAYSKDQLQ